MEQAQLGNTLLRLEATRLFVAKRDVHFEWSTNDAGSGFPHHAIGPNEWTSRNDVARRTHLIIKESIVLVYVDHLQGDAKGDGLPCGM